MKSPHLLLAVSLVLLCGGLATGADTTPQQQSDTKQSTVAEQPESPATTQPTATGPTRQPAPDQQLPAEEPATGEVTVEQVRAEKARLEADQNVEEDTRAAALKVLDQALGQLQTAQALQERAKQYQHSIETASQTLAELEQHIKTADTQPTTAPVLPDDISISQLEQEVVQSKAQAADAQQRLEELQAQRSRRAGRRAEIPVLIPQLREQITEVENELANLAAGDQVSVQDAARRMLLRSQQIVLPREISTYEKELLSYEATRRIIELREQLAVIELQRAQQISTALQEQLTRRRSEEASLAEQRARKARQELAQAHPAVQELADENLKLTSEQSRILQQMASAIELGKDARERAERLETRQNDLMEKARQAGVTKAIGLLLRSEREKLPDEQALEKQLDDTTAQIAVASIRELQLDDRKIATNRIDDAVEKQLAQTQIDDDVYDRQEIHNMLRDLELTRQNLLEELTTEYESYINVLVGLESAQRRLLNKVQTFAQYIDELILWFRSSDVLLPQTVWDGLRTFGAAVAPSSLYTTASGLWADMRSARPATYVVVGVFMAALLVLLLARRRLVTLLVDTGQLGSKRLVITYDQTFKALVLTVVLAMRWPLVVWFVGWRLSEADAVDPLVVRLGAGLQASFAVLLLLSMLRNICYPEGLGEKHFGWSQAAMKVMRAQLGWFSVAAVPLILIVIAVDHTRDDVINNTLGRTAFIVTMIVVSVALHKIFRARDGLLAQRFADEPNSWLVRLRHVWLTIMVIVPVLFAILAIAGYYYTATALVTRLAVSLWLVVGALVFHNMVVRWLLLARRKLAIQQARLRAEQAAAEESEKTRDPENVVATPDTQQISLKAVNIQTRQLLNTTVVVALFLGLWATWNDVLPALNVLDRVEIGSTEETITENIDGTVSEVTRTVPITLANVGLAIVVVIVTVLAGKNIPGLLEITILQKLPLDVGLRFAITTMSRYIIVVVGIIVAFSQLGVGWDKVQWLAAAVTFGLGFGLQEIFANFASGLIILFERPMRVGDTVTVGNVSGVVSKIRIRATTVTDWNRKELIVPNKEFVTGQLVNWTLTDRVLRVIIPVGVAYGSDTDKAKQLMLDVARNNENVLDDPEPFAIFNNFGDSSLNLELRAYLSDAGKFLSVTDQLTTGIDKAFREAGIEIPFPQRDLHVRSVRADLPIRRATPPPGDQ